MGLGRFELPTHALPTTITFVTIQMNVCSLDCVITISNFDLGSTSTVSTHLHTKYDLARHWQHLFNVERSPF